MIYYIIGIRRSGLHAIANWLFPMMGEFIYLNNFELGKLTDFEIVVKGNFNVLIGLENKPLDEVLKYTGNGKRIWVLREEDAVIKSQEKHYANAGLTEKEIENKILNSIHILDDYMDFIMKDEDQINVDDEFVISYESWNTDENYRKLKAEELGLQFNDCNKEKIFGYGKSSFV